MPDLDYFWLSRTLGAKMQPIGKPVFGSFGVLPLVAETAQGRLRHETSKTSFTFHQEKRMVRSFERTREGLPPNALLWDMRLRKRFLEACRQEGLDFDEANLVRGLIRIRKNPRKYAKHGIFLRPPRSPKNVLVF